MAITIITTPSNISSAYSSIVFEVTSNSTDIDTKILAEVYYRRTPKSFWRKCGKKIQDKYIDKYFYRFNISNLLQKVLTFDYVDESATGIYTPNQNSSVEYYVKFTEYWPDADEILTAHDTASSSTYWAVQSTMLKTESQSLSDYIIAAGSTKKFLSNSPSVVPIRVGEKVELHFLTTETDLKARIKETKANGTNSTSDVSLSSQELAQYMWDYEIDADNFVTIPAEGDSLGAINGSMKALPDGDNKIWGGLDLNAAVGSSIYVTVPGGFTKVSVMIIAQTANADFTPHYYYGGSWGSTTGFTALVGVPYTYTYTFPSGTTEFWLEKASGAGKVHILWGKFIYATDDIITKRAILNIDDTEIASDTAKIEVWIADGSNNVISEVRTFKADQVNLAESTRFAWLNHRGGFDHYTFTAGHEEVLEAEKVKFIRELQTTFTKADRGTGIAFVESNYTFTAFTQFESTEMLRWIAEIVESPEVYLIINDVRIAIDIITKEALPKKQSALLQMVIQWRFASPRNVQNG